MRANVKSWAIPLLLSAVMGVAATFYFFDEKAPSMDSASRCPSGIDLTDQVVSESLGWNADKVAAVKAARSLDNNDLCNMPQAKLDRAVHRTEHPKSADQPNEWAKFRAMQQADESGAVNPEGLSNALAQRHEMLALRSSAYRAGQLPPAAGISQGAWTAIGPGNIGGRIRTIVPHPTDANKLWLGSVSGGIWTTSNGGTSWTAVNDFMGNLAVSTMVVTPDGTTLYAGTGEGFFNGHAVRGAGIFKSTDGGVTWNVLANTSPSASSDWYYVNRLAMHPTNVSVLLAATNGGLYKTTDAGATWTKVSTESNVVDVKFNPTNGNAVVFSTGNSLGKIAYSSDAGSTWTVATTLGNRVELAYGSSDVVYASFDHASSGSGRILKSTDSGVNWSTVSTPGHLGNQGWYDNTIWVDPTNNNHLIIGGLDLHRSTDGGVNWNAISNWATPNSVHADHHAIVAAAGYDGTSNKTLYFGNDGGIYKANDITAVTSVTTGWTKLNNGLAITQFYSGAGHTGTNGRIIGGTQDNGSLLYAGSGTNWSEYYGGDGGYSDIDPADGNYIYGEYTNLLLHRSSNGGTSTDDICAGIGDANNQYCAGGNGSANFIAPFALDPNNSSTMLAGGVSLWRSLNVKAATPTWTVIKSPPVSNEPISALTASEGTGGSDKIWVGHNDGKLFKTTDGTAVTPTWSQVGVGTLPSGRMLLSILVDKDNHNKVYVSFGGFGSYDGYSTGNLWRTTDGGTSWIDISTGLPSAPIRSVQRHPGNANYLYVGTEVGIFASEDGGATWNTTNDGPANVSVDKLFWLDSTTLVAATHGRGMFKTTASLPSDTTPDVFTFTDQTAVALSTVVESNAITVAGINAAAAISVTGGEYSIGGGAFTSTAGTVTNGQTVKVRHTSSSSNSAAVNTVLTIGGVSDTFSSTTLANTTVDSDGDGVIDANDGSPNDAKVATPNDVQGNRITIAALTNLQGVVVLLDTDPSLSSTGKPNSSTFTFPNGVVKYTVTGTGVGATVTVTLTYPSTIPAGSKVYKITTAGYTEFAGASISSNQVTLTLTDGGAGDADGVANGSIEDPVAVATPVTNSGGSAGGGGGGGSFPLGWGSLLVILGLLLKRHRQAGE